MSVHPIKVGEAIVRNEKRALIGLAISFVVWWYFDGRKRYGMKGMRKYV